MTDATEPTADHLDGSAPPGRGCDGVLLRVVQRPDGTYLDVHGLDHLVFRRPDA